ncbi:MAG TPA: hypothetical protein VET26_00735 [Candidatus Sulfotelmatobacter sp.]|nr:hypothetical protein [Candidatus Sulfotelmatobacter sp.]
MTPIDGVALTVSLILLVVLVHRQLDARGRARRESCRDWFCWDCGAHVVATTAGWQTHRDLCSRRLLT